MASFKTTSLADQVFEKLENDIILGVYPPGEVLTELRLAEQLGVSRTPVREALRRLEQEQLIENTGNGSVVIGITFEALQDILDIRLRIEGLASYYAALNATPESLQELQHVVDLQEFYSTRSDADHLRIMDDNFHALIFKLSKRPVLANTLLPLHRKIQRYREVSLQEQSRSPQSVKEHRQIFEAIRSGDAKLAEQLTEEHLRNAKTSILERVTQNG